MIVLQLDLSTWKRCIVQSMEREPRSFDVVLVVHDESDTNTSSVCRLQGPWYVIVDRLLFLVFSLSLLQDEQQSIASRFSIHYWTMERKASGVLHIQRGWFHYCVSRSFGFRNVCSWFVVLSPQRCSFRTIYRHRLQ